MSLACPAGLSYMDALVIDLLARLQLHFNRLGCRLRLIDAPEDLVELVALMGLSDVLVVEPRGQAEQREEVLGVQKETDAGDLPA